MKTDLAYDPDLGAARKWAIILGFANLAAGAIHAYLGLWTVAGATMIWVLACVNWCRIIAAMQKTRDLGRVIEAGTHAAWRGIGQED